VRLDVADAAQVKVNYKTVMGTARSNGYVEPDYVSTSGSLIFDPGQLSKTVSVPIINNTIPESPENFHFYLSSPSANATIADSHALATIIDNDAPSGTPVVAINDFTVDEAAKEAMFVIALDRPSTSVVSMNYATQNGTAVAGSDFVAQSGSLNFAPGETVKTVKVTLTNDAAFESSEAFNLALSAITNATTLDAIGTAIIAENDVAPVSNSKISVDDIFVDEMQTYADFIVRLDAPNTAAVTVNYKTNIGTALSDGYVNHDYVSATGSLTFAPGEMVKTVRAAIHNDSTVEPAQNFHFGLSSASANATIADSHALATIIDNDAPSGTPVVVINDFTVDEATKEAMFVITLDRPSTSVVSMNYATQNGTAVAGSDFIAKSGSLNFAPGETVKTVNVTLTNDAAFESSEAFNLALSALTNATTLDAVGTAIIAENDAAPVSNSKISVDDIFVDESQTYADFIVRLDAPNTSTVTVNYKTVIGTARPDGYVDPDYVDTTGSLMFASGEMVKTVRVTLKNDSLPESPENFHFYLSSPSANATIADSHALATIIDNDAPSGTPVANIIDAVVDETDKIATVTVTLDKPSVNWTSLNVAGQNITAAGGDYRALQIGKIAFAPGETEKTVTFGLLNDAIVEDSELFDVVLTAPVGVTLGDARAHVVIAANDNAAVASPLIHVANVAAYENKGYLDFQVMLTAPSVGGAKVNYSTASGTATASDYSTTSGTLIFAPNELSKTLRISVTDDVTVEALENFTLNLSSAVNATIGTASASATLIDNESAAPAAPITLAGTAGNDVLQGTQFADAMTGAAGNDVFNGGEGNDSMNGAGGNDTYLLENAGDTYTEGAAAGTDTVISYLPAHTLGANVEKLQLVGAAVTGIGNGLNNTVLGNAANNTLNGGAGGDTLDGAAGSDNLSGAAGVDFFAFTTAVNAATNVDVITDFSVTDDTIRLENAIFTKFTATGALPAGTFVSGPGAVALDANDHLIYNTTTGALAYDADGNGAGAQVVFATLTGAPALTPADFAVI